MISLDTLRFGWSGQDWIEHTFGLFLELNLFILNLVYIVLLVVPLGCLNGLISAIRMFRYSPVDDMNASVGKLLENLK